MRSKLFHWSNDATLYTMCVRGDAWKDKHKTRSTKFLFNFTREILEALLLCFADFSFDNAITSLTQSSLTHHLLASCLLAYCMNEP